MARYWFLLVMGIVAATFSAAQPAEAQSYITQCAAALKPDSISLHQNRYAQAAVIQTLSTSNSVSKKQDGSFDVPDYFSGSYSSSEEAKSSLSSYRNASWSTSDYLGYVAAYVPKAAYQAYSDCIKSALGREGMSIEIQEADEDSVTVVFHFSGPKGSESRYTALVTSDGLPVTAVKRTWRSHDDTQVVRIMKVDPSKSLHITANIVGGPTTPPGDSASIPPYIRTSLVSSKVTGTAIDPTSVQCGGNNDYNTHADGAYGPPLLPDGSDDFYDQYPQVGMETATSWNGPGPVDPRYSWDTLTNKIIRLHTVCTVGSGLGDNRFFVRSKVDYTLNHYELKTISPLPSNKPIKDAPITEGGGKKVTLASTPEPE